MTTDPPPGCDASLVKLLEEQRLALQRANDALAEREARLRAIFDAEPECVKLLDAGGRLIDINPAGLRMLEAGSLAQVRATDLSALVVEEHRPAFRELVERVFRGETGHLEFQMTTLGGARRWMDSHAAPLGDAAGRVTALLAITRDVTERRQTEEALRESERRNRAIAELVSDYAYTFRVTPDGRLEGEWVTDSFTRVFGLTLAQVAARGGWQRLVHPDDLPAALQHVQKTWRGRATSARCAGSRPPGRFAGCGTTRDRSSTSGPAGWCASTGRPRTSPSESWPRPVSRGSTAPTPCSARSTSSSCGNRTRCASSRAPAASRSRPAASSWPASSGQWMKMATSAWPPTRVRRRRPPSRSSAASTIPPSASRSRPGRSPPEPAWCATTSAPTRRRRRGARPRSSAATGRWPPSRSSWPGDEPGFSCSMPRPKASSTPKS